MHILPKKNISPLPSAYPQTQEEERVSLPLPPAHESLHSSTLWVLLKT